MKSAPSRFGPARFASIRFAPAQSKCSGGSQIETIVVVTNGIVSAVVLALLEQETSTTDNSTPMGIKFVICGLFHLALLRQSGLY